MGHSLTLGAAGLLLAFACTFGGCPSPQPVAPVSDADAAPPPQPPQPDAATTAEVSVPGEQACEAACATLAAHGCPSARVADGGACVPVCTSTIGSPFNVNPDCIAACADFACIRGCGDPCQGGH